MRRLCGPGLTWAGHSEGPGNPPYGHYGLCARSSLDGAAQEGRSCSQARSGVGGTGQGATRWNAAMER
jgi:hypothetical protein